VPHDGGLYDLIQGQSHGQGHETCTVRNFSIFGVYLIHYLQSVQCGLTCDCWFLN